MAPLLLAVCRTCVQLERKARASECTPLPALLLPQKVEARKGRHTSTAAAGEETHRGLGPPSPGAGSPRLDKLLTEGDLPAPLHPQTRQGARLLAADLNMPDTMPGMPGMQPLTVSSGSRTWRA